MDEGTRIDLQFIRHERAQNTPRAVLLRAATVRQYLRQPDDGYIEATIHMAWAYVRLNRANEARPLYTWLMTQIPWMTPLLHMYTLCDRALFLHQSGETDEAHRLVTQALNLASATQDSQLASICAQTAAEIAIGPTEPSD